MKISHKKWIISLSKHLKYYSIICGVLMYILGVSIASYLAHPIRLGTLILGLALVIVILFLSTLIDLYVEQVQYKKVKNIDEERSLKRQYLTTLSVIASFLMIIALLIILINQSGGFGLESWILLIFIIALSIIKSPIFIQLRNNTFKELIEGIIIVGFIPSLSFILLAGELQRFLPLISFPLLFIYLATQLAFKFPKFAGDVAHGRQTLLVILGWQTGVFLHDLFVLLGFCTLGFSSLLGLPWLITWPVFIALPVGVFEIWQLYRISQGNKPNWNFLKVTSISLFVLPSYLLIFSLLIN